MNEYEAGATAPPFHPFCRTTTAPYFEDMEDIATRIARDDETGATYEVAANMSYNEWRKKHVEGGLLPDAKPDIIKHKEPDIGYRDMAKAEKQLMNDATIWESGLNDVSKTCVREYTGDIFKGFNSWTRGGMKTPNKEFEYLIAGLDAGILSFDLTKDVSVIRGTSTGVLKALGYDMDNIIGQTFTDKAYMSSCISQEIAWKYANNAVIDSGGKRVYMQMDIPAGRGRGAYINNLSEFDEEVEFLIRRGARFEFYDKVELDGDILLKARWIE